jgi:hypothetical protein
MSLPALRWWNSLAIDVATPSLVCECEPLREPHVSSRLGRDGDPFEAPFEAQGRQGRRELQGTGGVGPARAKK